MTRKFQDIPRPTQEAGDALRSAKRSSKSSTDIVQQIGEQKKPRLDSKETATSFLRRLYGDQLQGYLTLWSLANKKTHWFKANEPASIADEAVKLADSTDVCFKVGLKRERIDGCLKGSAKDVIAIPGLWADVDVNCSAYKGLDYPLAKEAALKLVADLRLQPTVGGRSGHSATPPAVWNRRSVNLPGSTSAWQGMLPIAVRKRPFYGRGL